MAEQSLEKLTKWQKAHQLMLDVHKRLVPLLPKEAKDDLADQVRRSSKSVPANIAELLRAIWDIVQIPYMRVYAAKSKRFDACSMDILRS